MDIIRKDIKRYKLKELITTISFIIVVFVILKLFAVLIAPKISVNIPINLIYLPLLGSILFGVCHALLHLKFGDRLEELMKNFRLKPEFIATTVASLFALIALYFGNIIEEILKIIFRSDIEISPFQEVIGLLIGTAIILTIYNKIWGIFLPKKQDILLKLNPSF